MRKGRPWSLSLEDRVLLVAAYWRTNLTLRRLAPLFGVSKSTADRIVDRLGPALALQLRWRFAKDTVLIVDGTPVSTRDRSVAASGKIYRHSTSHQVVIDAGPCLVVAVGEPLPGNRDDWRAWEESGAKTAVGTTPAVIADGGYRGTGLTIPHYRRHRDEELPSWKEEHNASHRKVRVRVEHTCARMKSWKILRDGRLGGEGDRHAMLGIPRLHHLTLTGWQANEQVNQHDPECLRDSVQRPRSKSWRPRTRGWSFYWCRSCRGPLYATGSLSIPAGWDWEIDHQQPATAPTGT
ncbi:hypothetical protein GCM10010249_59850 [Streptomyces roseolilacinus]|uniref:Transposase n=1 Tax=Streptomyces roseolilacinus TaxID=66904 RepID=A0A918B885_9ACTN|nr:hypothetical protein GCM10010249_59850 [Streptomyces roseolilacinus]